MPRIKRVYTDKNYWAPNKSAYIGLIRVAIKLVRARAAYSYNETLRVPLIIRRKA